MKSKRAIWWGLALFLVLAGTMGASLILPGQTKSKAGSAPDIRVPAMRNVPDSSERPLELEAAPEKP